MKQAITVAFLSFIFVFLSLTVQAQSVERPLVAARHHDCVVRLGDVIQVTERFEVTVLHPEGKVIEGEQVFESPLSLHFGASVRVLGFLPKSFGCRYGYSNDLLSDRCLAVMASDRLAFVAIRLEAEKKQVMLDAVISPRR